MVAAVDLNELGNPEAEKAYCEAWQFLSGSDLSTELAPVPWLVEALAVAPGAVTIIGGAGFGGKTVSMQSLALAVASGMPVWGQFPVTKGRVVHLDYEQGQRLTQDRYQRIAKYMGLQLANCELSVSCLPTAHLDDSHSESTMRRICDGARVCIVDAFRGAFPTANENDSCVRAWLDMLQRVSDRMQCTIIVIAHSRKMGADVDVRSSLRGSGALFDAAQTVYMLDGSPNKPTQVHNTKDRLLGETRDTFGLRIRDVSDPHGEGNRRWGLCVEYVDSIDLASEYAKPERDDNRLAINVERLTSMGLRIGSILAGAPDGLTLHTLKGLLFGERMSDVQGAVDMLIQTGAVRSDGKVLYTNEPREPGVD